MKNFLAILKENIVYEVPSNDQVITDLVEIFRANEPTTVELGNINNSLEIPIVSTNMANVSLKTMYIFLLQQNNTEEYVNALKK
ncbi:24072_t:CDS:1 [Gigaspora rosea]|nr:24072_t:CDS:1 [Gigaspora rosea]